MSFANLNKIMTVAHASEHDLENNVPSKTDFFGIC